MRRTATMIALVALTVACSAGETAPPLDDVLSTSTDTNTPGAATASSAGEEDPTMAGDLEHPLRYGHAGGFVPVEDLAIAVDGSAELTSGGNDPVTFQLDPDVLDAIVAAVHEADLAEQPEGQMSDPAAPDALTYELTYGDSTILTDELAAPDELKQLLDLLFGVVEDHRPDR